MQKLRAFQPGDFWLVTVAAATWGTIGIVTQAIYNTDTTTSLFINLGRMLFATPVLLVACWRIVGRDMFKVRRRDFVIMLLTGIFLAASQAAYFAAIRLAGVTIATLLTICISPIVVSIVSVAMRFEKLSARLVIALVCAVGGSVLLVGLHSPEGTHYDLLLGAVFSILSAATYAGMIVCGRFLAGGYHPLQVTAVTFGAGTVVLVLVNLVSGIVTVHTAQGWLLLMYLGLVPTALAYWMFQKGLRTVPATAASIISMLEPLVAGLLAWILFGERLAPTGLIGGALLLLSIILLSMDSRKDTLEGGMP